MQKEKYFISVLVYVELVYGSLWDKYHRKKVGLKIKVSELSLKTL